jgi:hypothetical protein
VVSIAARPAISFATLRNNSLEKGESKENLIMFRVCRHDAITLHSEVREEDFERFMKEALVPHFSEQDKGPTRSSIADLKSQSLFKDTKGQRKYLWITVWDGGPESVRGSSFEHTRMSRPEAAEAMLKELESFGKRATEIIFSELVNIEVATNT